MILNTSLMSMLESVHCTPGQKVDLIEGLSVVFKTPQSIVDLYYNFDNELNCPNLFARLISIISKITEGSYKPVNKYGMSEDNLQHAGLAILTNIMELATRWIAVPGLAHDDRNPRSSVSLSSNEDDDDFDEDGFSFIIMCVCVFGELLSLSLLRPWSALKF